MKNKYVDKLSMDMESESDPFSKACMCYQILSVLPELEGGKERIYSYTKKYVVNLLKALESRSYAYDEFSPEKIEKIVSAVPPEIGHKIYSCVCRYLEIYNYKEHVHWAKINKREQLFLLKKQSNPFVYHICKGMNWMTYVLFGTWRRVVSTMLAYYTVASILLAEGSATITVFTFKKVAFCEDIILNHIINVFALSLSLHSGISLVPSSIIGIVLLGCFKIFMIIFVVNIAAFFVTSYFQEIIDA